MTTVLAVVAGALGALARYEIGGLVQRRAHSPRPWGTAVVNLTGAAALGVLVGLHLDGGLDADWVRVAGTGFLGAFTTFSTWMVDMYALASERSMGGVRAAALNVVAMAGIGVVAAGLGLAAGRALT